jgi:hypothetical protein
MRIGCSDLWNVGQKLLGDFPDAVWLLELLCQVYIDSLVDKSIGGDIDCIRMKLEELTPDAGILLPISGYEKLKNKEFPSAKDCFMQGDVWIDFLCCMV